MLVLARRFLDSREQGLPPNREGNGGKWFASRGSWISTFQVVEHDNSVLGYRVM